MIERIMPVDRMEQIISVFGSFDRNIHIVEDALGVRVGRLRQLADGRHRGAGVLGRQLAYRRRVERRLRRQAAEAEQ